MSTSTTQGVIDRADALKQAISIGEHRLDPQAATTASHVLDRITDRVRLGADLAVVALAGATGSGKSSLFNALAGTKISASGARRPTTDTSTALVWGDGTDPLLDWLQVPRRHRLDSVLTEGTDHAYPGLILLDLPDHDSTAAAHRAIVDRMVRLVDMLVWVVDPQKYADDALHTTYLAPMADHQGVTVMVLNQIDRLTPEGQAEVEADLRQLMKRQGLGEVPIVLTSAVTGEGIDELRALLKGVIDKRKISSERIDADLKAAVRGLRPSVGEREPSTGVAVSKDLVDSLAAAAGGTAVLDAVQADYVRQARKSTGWPFALWVNQFRGDPLKRLGLGEANAEVTRLRTSGLPDPTKAQTARVDLATEKLARAASEGLPLRWERDIHQTVKKPRQDLADDLDQAILNVPLDQRRPIWWSLVALLQLVFAIALVIGVLWLGAKVLVAWLALGYTIDNPDFGRFNAATWLIILGALGGLLVTFAAKPFVTMGAKRRRNRMRKRISKAVTVLAEQTLLEPVTRILDDHKETRIALDSADQTR